MRPIDPAVIIFMTAIIIAIIAAMPRWPYSKGWGWRPAGIIIGIFVAVIFLLITGVW